MTGIIFDSSDFEKRLLLLEKKVVPMAVAKGVTAACFELANDSLNEEPTPPIDEATLRGSLTVFVQSDRKATGKDFDASTDDAFAASQHTDPTESRYRIVGTVGFNMEYAAQWHETEPKGPPYVQVHHRQGMQHSWPMPRSTPFWEPTAGKKFLESKVSSHFREYIKVAAAIIKKDLSVK